MFKFTLLSASVFAVLMMLLSSQPGFTGKKNDQAESEVKDSTIMEARLSQSTYRQEKKSEAIVDW